MTPINRLWGAVDIEDVEECDRSLWLEIIGIKTQYTKEGETIAAAVRSVLELVVLNNVGVPSELRIKILGSVLGIADFDSWDKAFGPLKPKGKHKKPRKPLPTELDVWTHIYGLVVGDGLPLTVPTFEQAGEELGIGSRTCQNMYYSYANENGLSLAGADFSEQSKKLARAARQSLLMNKDSAKN